MKKYKQVAVLIGMLFLFFIFIMKLSGGGRPIENVSDGENISGADTLTLTVQVGSGGDFFEIGQPLAASVSMDFSQPLQMKGSSVDENGNYVWQFGIEGAGPDTVYVKQPILYRPVEIAAVSVPLVVGATSQIDGEDWFSVSAADISENPNGTYTVRVEVSTLSGDLLRRPKLCVGGKEFSPISGGQNFQSGEFIFQVMAAAQSKEEAASAVAAGTLKVEDALLRVDAGEMVIRSDKEGVSVLVVGGE